VARESATFENHSSGAGFDKFDHDVDIAARLEEWQSAQDQRLWKLIVSPEPESGPIWNASHAT
jgi:hypothetical protein